MAQQHQSIVYRAVHILCVLLLGGVVQAQEDARDASARDVLPAPHVEAEDPRVGAVDEIVITGPRTVRNLTELAGRLTLNIYDLLNSAIDDPEFQINCTRESAAGTRVRRQTCRVRYYEIEEGHIAREVLRARSEGRCSIREPCPVDLRLSSRWDKQQEFNERILQAVNEDPALNRAFWQLYELMEEIEELRAVE